MVHAEVVLRKLLHDIWNGLRIWPGIRCGLDRQRFPGNPTHCCAVGDGFGPNQQVLSSLGSCSPSGGKTLGELFQQTICMAHRVLPALHRARHIYDELISYHAILQ